jgi:hypothetical protein
MCFSVAVTPLCLYPPAQIVFVGRMRRKTKDRIVSALLILLFLGVIGGSAYFIVRTMMHWNAKGLG